MLRRHGGDDRRHDQRVRKKVITKNGRSAGMPMGDHHAGGSGGADRRRCVSPRRTRTITQKYPDAVAAEQIVLRQAGRSTRSARRRASW